MEFLLKFLTNLPLLIALLLTLLVFLFFVNLKIKNKIIEGFIRWVSLIFIFFFGFYLVVFAIFSFVEVTNFMYWLLYQGTFWAIRQQKVASYISLTATLFIILYIPKIAGAFTFLLGRFINKKEGEWLSGFTNRFLKSIRLDIWIYLLSFFLLIISTVEKLSTNKVLIQSENWMSYKDIIPESVLSFIAFNDFLRLIKENKNYKKILREPILIVLSALKGVGENQKSERQYIYLKGRRHIKRLNKFLCVFLRHK